MDEHKREGGRIVYAIAVGRYNRRRNGKGLQHAFAAGEENYLLRVRAHFPRRVALGNALGKAARRIQKLSYKLGGKEQRLRAKRNPQTHIFSCANAPGWEINAQARIVHVHAIRLYLL